MSKESDDLLAGIAYVGKDHKKEKRKADAADRIRPSSQRTYGRPKLSKRKAAWMVMEDAYNKASSNGRYLANARQIFYAARPLMLRHRDISNIDSAYFTQTLLKDYIEEERPSWWRNVVWDARGHFTPPHSDHSLGVGGQEVRAYVRQAKDAEMKPIEPKLKSGLSMTGPDGHFGSVLFIEKEGFNEIIQRSGLLQEFDVALMSTKGVPVAAACELLSSIQKKVRIFVLHDFDVSGFTIVKTLREGTRLAAGSEVIDWGLRLEDIGDLQREAASTNGAQVAWRLRLAGATREEIEILVQHQYDKSGHGERVELNAMTSKEFIEFLRAKFVEHKVCKATYSDELLSQAYRSVYKQVTCEQVVRKLLEDDKFKIREQAELSDQVSAILQEDPRLHWSEAVRRVVNHAFGLEDDVKAKVKGADEEGDDEVDTEPQPVSPPPASPPQTLPTMEDAMRQRGYTMEDAMRQRGYDVLASFLGMKTEDDEEE